MDDQNFFRQFFRTVLHELFRSKTAYNVLACIILLAFVAAGFLWQERYTSITTLALKSGKTNPDLVSIQLERIESVVFSRAFQQNIASEIVATYSKQSKKSTLPYDQVFSEHVSYRVLPRNLIQIRLVAGSPTDAKNLLNSLLDHLNARLSPEDELLKLNQQINVLGIQLARSKAEKEEKQKILAEKKSAHDVSSSPRSRDRVLSVNEAIQDVEVSINASNAKIDGILRQLEKEEKVFNLRSRLRTLTIQKEKVNQRLSEAQQIYDSTSPDVVSLTQELDNINIEIASIVENPLVVASNAAEGESLYEELRKQLTLERVERESLVSRHASLEKILLKESKKNSDNQAYIADVSSAQQSFDEVAKQFEEINSQFSNLVQQRKTLLEKSPQLNIVDEPSEPETYAGLGFIEFLIMGPIFAFGVPFLLASVLVISDSRIRTLHKLRRVTPRSVPVLGVIPHYNSPKTMRLFRKALFGLAVWGVFVFSVYFTVGVIGLKGM